MPEHYSLASQAYIWSQKFYEEKIDFDDNLERVFSEARFAGIPSLEFSTGNADTEAKIADLQRLSDSYGITTPLFFAGGTFHDPQEVEPAIERIVSEARRLKSVGCVGITTNPSPKPGGASKTSVELKTQAEALNRLGSALAGIDMQLYYHTHDPEIRHDAREFRFTCDHTDPDLLKLCYDVHWVYRGGADPIGILKQYLNRMGTLHVRNSSDAVWQESFGEGDIDYSEVHRILSEASFEGWLILELATEPRTTSARTLKDNLKLSMEAMRDIFQIDG